MRSTDTKIGLFCTPIVLRKMVATPYQSVTVSQQPYDRLQNESDLQWMAFCCYRDLGLERSLIKAYTDYRKRKVHQGTSKHDRIPSQVPSSFKEWCKIYDWDDRARVWDSEREERERQLLIQSQGEQYTKELEEFRQAQKTSGRAKSSLGSELLEKISTWVDTESPIASWGECEKVVRILVALEAIGDQQLASALQIEELLTDIELSK